MVQEVAVLIPVFEVGRGHPCEVIGLLIFIDVLVLARVLDVGFAWICPAFGDRFVPRVEGVLRVALSVPDHDVRVQRVEAETTLEG